MHTTVLARKHEGKADPIWGTAFTTKFSRRPATDANLVTPKGALNVIERFVDRAAELDYLINTQHLQLATTQETLRANGIGSVSLNSAAEGSDPLDIAEADGAEYDPTALALMKRRIEWEQFIFGSGPIHTARFEATEQGTTGIAYIGAKKFATADVCLATRRALKEAWITRFGTLPTMAEVEERRAFCEYYGMKPVLAHMTEDERNEDTNSRRFGAEDPDPERIAFHAENPRTAILTPMVTYDEEGEPEWSMVTDDLPGGMVDVGYAGPKGFLGLDDGADDVDDEFDYFTGYASVVD
jgi:hypothetical protein